MGVFIAIWLQLFFRKFRYNFYELLILLCFVIGIMMLVLSLFTLLQGLTALPVMHVAAVLIMGYFSWAVGQFFDPGKSINYLKAFASYAFGMITFAISLILVGQLVDYLKHSL